MATIGLRERTHCPQCFRPVSFSPKPVRGFPKGRAHCDGCGKNYQPENLVEAVRCSVCGTWLDARGIRDARITCGTCGKYLDVRGENTRVREDTVNLPLRCPTCMLPIRYRQKGAASLPYCEACGENVDPAVLIRAVQCSVCFGWISCASVRGGRVNCPHCGRLLAVTGSRVENLLQPAEIGETDEWLVYASPAKAPVRALPGYTPMAVLRGRVRRVEDAELENGDLLYVCGRFPRALKLGTASPLELSDGRGGAMYLRAAADAEMEVAVPERFLEWVGYRPVRQRELPGADTLRDCFTRAVFRAADEALREGQPLTALGLGDGVCRAFSEALEPETGLTCRSIRMQSLRTEAAVDRLAARVERPIRWVTDSIQVHESQHPELWAHVTLSGTAHIRIADRTALSRSTCGVRWSLPATQEYEAERFLSDRIGEQVYAYFQEQLQGVIEDTGVHVDYLGHYLTYMQRVAERFLNEENDLLRSMGLRAANVTVALQPEDIRYSPALQKHEAVEREITMGEMDDRLRAYAEKMARDQEQAGRQEMNRRLSDLAGLLRGMRGMDDPARLREAAAQAEAVCEGLTRSAQEVPSGKDSEEEAEIPSVNE